MRVAQYCDWYSAVPWINRGETGGLKMERSGLTEPTYSF